MLGLDLGFERFKFFPAEASGGIAALKAIAGPFGSARFCPTGGITHATAGNWLALEAVLCVGGSWVVPKGPVDKHAIETAARAAKALAK
jgi:2-dehydro-3-deoxyphosphogluconate aldolase/(4S)-4-hydroxy-2-oxoglutarate aldolase